MVSRAEGACRTTAQDEDIKKRFAQAHDETAKARSYQTLPPPQEDRFALLFFPHGQKSILLFCYAARPLEGEG